MARRLMGCLRENLFRAVIISMIVGSVLLLINHGDHITQEPICKDFWTKCGLTYLVPFIVSMVSVGLVYRRTERLKRSADQAARRADHTHRAD